MTWQPIETFIQDSKETFVLLYRPSWKGGVNSSGIDVAFWDNDKYAFKPRPFWHSLFYCTTKADMRNHLPTHWQPIPVPPNVDETNPGLTALDLPADENVLYSEYELKMGWNKQADLFNQWESLDPGEQLEWAQTCAIAADRAKHATPARLRCCPTHGQQSTETWACPECLRELREELNNLGEAPAALATSYEFEILDENDEFAAGGSSHDYGEALREGQRYLLQYSEEETHTLTVARKEILLVNTISQAAEKNQ